MLITLMIVIGFLTTLDVLACIFISIQHFIEHHYLFFTFGVIGSIICYLLMYKLLGFFIYMNRTNALATIIYILLLLAIVRFTQLLWDRVRDSFRQYVKHSHDSKDTLRMINYWRNNNGLSKKKRK